MRNAPSVNYPVGRSAFQRRLLLGLAALSALALAGLIWLYPGLGAAPVAAGWLLWLGWCAFAVRSWRQAPAGVLRWDAEAVAPESLEGPVGRWRWQPAGAEWTDVDRLAWRLDAQKAVLLHFKGGSAGRGGWLWLDAASDPLRWHALRQALTAHAGS